MRCVCVGCWWVTAIRLWYRITLVQNDISIYRTLCGRYKRVPWTTNMHFTTSEALLLETLRALIHQSRSPATGRTMRKMHLGLLCLCS